MADPLRLYGLKAIVTGAASGIGEAIARTFIKHGADVLAVDAPSSGIDRQFSSVRGITGFEADFRDAGGIDAMLRQATEMFGGADIVVCNVDAHPDQPIAPGDDATLDRAVQAKHELLTSICDKAMPLLEKSPAGRIILIGFVRSFFAQQAHDAFSESERRLAELTRDLGTRVGEFGITANYIQPGAIMTPDSRRVFSKDKGLRDFCIGMSAAKRLGEPIDVAKVALFLATDDSVFVNGAGIVVDGGASAQ